MKHHILVKLTEKAKAQPELYDEVEKLFSQSTEIAGVHGVCVSKNIVDRPNRYDLMIVIDMDRSALDAYDSSDMHLRWKREFSSRILQKAIFDCD
ncbi:MAG: hypothetical protein PHI27_03105 [Eubacteriales bacterium]|nr:hypothetical protein [Eubacteriales bacterium]MDD3881224.1 hypothetical protein [Eubacteriales bacterium]MDD4512142.1 hypothetical protein [Eubacteriales bacterium]